MPTRVTSLCCAALLAATLGLSGSTPGNAEDAIASPSDGGVVKVRSAYPLGPTIERLKQDIASKELMFFSAIDQSQLAGEAGIELRPSTLLVFGNPALGSLFITSNPAAGLDWPVRLLVFEDKSGQVWAAYTDFAYIARRHHISDRDEAFKKASMVIASITASVEAK
jgi:uncharacterized protein (DUF302 family)